MIGEISNFSRSPNGHCYFKLKDDQALLSCVMWKTQVARLSFRPENGMRVVATGRITVYAPSGQYQLQVTDLRPEGIGDIYAAFHQLKARLEKEGLFAATRKRRIPLLPRRIGLVTSPRGAALHDMLTTLLRRHPGVDVVLSPAVVQGVDAPPSIIAALGRLARLAGGPDAVDVVIVARGGGSFEELNAFNDEGVARTIASFPVPVISGVGHETDFTIADFVADERAATPTAAATRAIPDCVEARLNVRRIRVRLAQALVRMVDRHKDRLRLLEQRGFARLVDRMLDTRRRRLDDLSTRLVRAQERRVERRRAALAAHAGRLDALSPFAVLERGYAVCTTADGHVVKRIGQVEPGAAVDIRVLDGSLQARVEGAHVEATSAGEQLALAGLLPGADDATAARAGRGPRRVGEEVSQ